MKKKIIKFLSILLIFIFALVVSSCEGILPTDIGGGGSDPIQTQLDQVTNVNVTVNKQTVTISFDEVDNADYYKAFITKDSSSYDYSSITNGSSKEYPAGIYTVYISAFSYDDDYTESEKSETITFEVEEPEPELIEKLATPKNISTVYSKNTERLTISFDDDASYVNKSFYQVSFYRNGSLKYTKTLSAIGGTVDCSDVTAGTYTIKIKAKTSDSTKNYDSDYSDEYEVVIEKEGAEKEQEPLELTGYYADASGLKGSALESALTTIITTTHVTITSYEDLKWALQQTDEDPNNSSNIILFYCGASISKDWGNGNNWNREHVWPNSKGVGKTGPGADCHHLRPADPKVNSTRSNYRMGNVTNGTQIYYGGTGTGCYYSGSVFEPADRIKGDVARIYFYLLVRYPALYSNLSSVGDIKTLLEWNELDPVDEMEIRRNNAAYAIQGNRNPFIDHSEFAELIWNNK